MNYICSTYTKVYNWITDINSYYYDLIREGKMLTYAEPFNDYLNNLYWFPIETIQYSNTSINFKGEIEKRITNSQYYKTEEEYNLMMQNYLH